MIIHLIHPCSAFDYLTKIEVPKATSCKKLFNLAIIVSYKERKISIPLSNIAAIED
jgi:hypothetical protein